MHLFIDIREPHPHDTIRTRYAETWVNLWKKYHASDTFSFLIFEEQEKKDSSYIVVPKPSWFPYKKSLEPKKQGIFRCINFSDLPPYDLSIPTISHVFDNTRWLYPEEKNMGYWGRKGIENERKRIVRNSRSVIVPNMFTGNELVELWHAKEEKIEIIPYIPIPPQEEDASILPQFQIEKPYFLYDGTYGNESNIIGLLKGFETYRHTQGGKYTLVLHGKAGDELSHITQLLRTFDIVHCVKFVGSLGATGREAIYKNAGGWISVGSYFSGGPTIELARAYNLPLLLSDIKPFEGNMALKILPNHLEELGALLKRFETYVPTSPQKVYDEQAYVHAYEKLIAKGN